MAEVSGVLKVRWEAEEQYGAMELQDLPGGDDWRALLVMREN